jgi:DNA repair protein RecN (Recombination protein N)
MISNLKIRNYALIESLEIGFVPGFITITGETGAGKSILMGALSLILGQRADTSVLKDRDKKCIVEGQFHIDRKLKEFFAVHDLDYDEETLIRREILPGGKSRAFINDTPVTLQVLKELGDQLVDIHSQHQNLRLNDHVYQLEVVDHVAKNAEALDEYARLYRRFTEKKTEIAVLRDEFNRLKGDLDYFKFQFDELERAGLKAEETEELEQEIGQLEHAEEIKLALLNGWEALENEGQALQRVKDAGSMLDRIKQFFSPGQELSSRLESVHIELKDVAGEIQQHADRIEYDPERLLEARNRLDQLFSLMQKHRVQTVEELIAVRDALDNKISGLELSDERLASLEKEVEALDAEIRAAAAVLHAKRTKAGDHTEKVVVAQLRELKMPHATFRVEVTAVDTPGSRGMDEVRFLFSANKNEPMEEVSKVASGGEVSRLMLCIKSLLTEFKGLPTLIFDEIDSGVSGDIADKVGTIMKQMSQARQVVAITHLPQVASQGDEHFMVFKEDEANATVTRIRQLDSEERVVEIAKLLSGKEVTDAALSNARELLRN